MDAFVFLAVLAAAAFHAGWNALLKLRLEPIVATALVAIASGVVVIPWTVATGPPDSAAWPYLLGSVAVHIVYYLTLAEAYRSGDLGQIYPIARGTAPLMTAALATVWLHETPGIYGWAGIIVLAAGILLLAFKGGRTLEAFDARSVGFALLTSLTITCYTLVDGLGARTAGSPAAYTAWLFLLSGGAMAVYAIVRVGPGIGSAFLANWKMAMAGAALSTAAYAIAIWAMTVAPIALVAALRETSVLFAALFGTLLLREPLLLVRVLAAFLVLAGALLVRMR
ncbi:MAG: EamA family transporter [Hyphomicrobiaceae bacterium]|nr:MAG: EamA family transporter [Hyphomicrobiaceae bacterium]